MWFYKLIGKTRCKIMKRNTMRMLSLLLTLVMLLGAIPFASAAAPTVEVDPGQEIWAGEQVHLNLPSDALAGSIISDVQWTGGAYALSGHHVIVNPTETTTYTASYNVAPLADTTAKTAGTPVSVTITVKKPAGSNFAITGGNTAATDQTLSLGTVGHNDATVTWSVDDTVYAEISNTGVFKASKAGKYTVTAKASAPDVMDNKEATLEITVSDAAYTVTLNNASYAMSAKNAKMTYTVKKGTAAYTGTMTKQFHSSNTAVATINATTGELVLRKAGTSTITLTVVIDGQTYTDTAVLTVTDSGVITLEQDGDSFDDDTVELEFDIPSLDSSYNSDVDWEFEVTGLDKLKFVFSKNSKDEYSIDNEDPDISIDVKASNGYGVARIDAYAKWGNGTNERAEGTFYIAVYDEIDYKLKVDDKVDDFQFDDDEVFSSVTIGTKKYEGTQAKSYSIVELLDDDTATHVEFEEKKPKNNKDVGKIEYSKSGNDYDPDEVNTFRISNELEYLEFETDEEGNYDIEYTQYQYVTATGTSYSKPFITGEGTLRIIVGEGSDDDDLSGDGDIEYKTDAKGEVSFDEDDFNDFWEDYCDDEDIDDEDLDYVKFDFKATSLSGSLYANDGNKTLTTSMKLFYKYDDDEDSGYDLDEVIYKASKTKTSYVDEIDFICYGEDGEKAEGTIAITVGKGEEEQEQQQPTTPGNSNFSDVAANAWYYNAVSYVSANGIMTGTTSTTFSPNTYLNRAMVATVLYRMAGSPTVTGVSPFADVKNTNDWYYNAVVWAQKNGIVTGTTATTFAPGNNITRQDLALMLYRFARYQGKSVTATGSLTSFSDNASVGSWASTALQWAVGQGIITGSAGRLNPTGTATRAEAAAMLQRYMGN